MSRCRIFNEITDQMTIFWSFLLNFRGDDVIISPAEFRNVLSPVVAKKSFRDNRDLVIFVQNFETFFRKIALTSLFLGRFGSYFH